MLVIGRALMARPTMLLLDEPSLGLAPRIVAQIFGLVRTLVRDEGLERAPRRAERPQRPVRRRPRRRAQPRTGRRRRPRRRAGRRRPAPPRLPRILTRRGPGDSVQQFFNTALTGLTLGMVYAAFALALVLIWRSTRIVNFAQAPMAMFTTFVALVVIDAGPQLLARLRRRPGLRAGPRRRARAGGDPAGGGQGRDQRGDPDPRPVHRAARAGRRHLRQPLPLVPGTVRSRGLPGRWQHHRAQRLRRLHRRRRCSS